MKNEDESIFSGFSVEGFYSDYINYSNINVKSSRNSAFNNFGIGLYYDINDKFQLGAECRLEKFDFNYSGSLGFNNLYNIDQQSQILSMGLNMRYYPFEIQWLKPYSQIQFGANKYGFIVRTGIGAEIPIKYKFSVLTGIDLSYFIYKHQNNTFTNSKSGIYAILKYHL